MKLYFTDRAKRDWQKLDREVREQLRSKLSFYSRHKNLLQFARKLKNSLQGEYRFRVGDYRLIFDCAGDAIYILRIGHRKDIYN